MGLSERPRSCITISSRSSRIKLKLFTAEIAEIAEEGDSEENRS
jgi:hypothetical protein